MDTLSDMRNALLKMYISSVKRFPDEKKENVKYITDDSEEYESDDENFSIQTSRIQYIIDNITSMDSSKEFELLSLLVFYYYLIVFQEHSIIADFSDIVNEDPIIPLVENEDLEVIIEGLISFETGYLYDILQVIIDEDISSYDIEVYEERDIDDYNEYFLLNNISENNKAKEIFRKLHPNLEEEQRIFTEYKKDEFYSLKLKEIEITSLSTFIQLFSVASQQIKSQLYLKGLILDILDNLKNNNIGLYNIIFIYILKYCYIESYLHDKENFEKTKIAIINNIHNICNVNEYFIEQFIDYDLTSYIYDYNNLSDEEKEELELIVSIKNTKTFGIDGTWKKYMESDKKKLIRYVPSWNLESDNTYLIYYSIDEHGDYNIPRICIKVENNKIIDINGREYENNIEFELLDILEKKIKEYSNYEKLNSGLKILKILKLIEDKINNGAELELGEIDILYEINYKIDELLFSSYEYKMSTLREIANDKKNLSKYFGCSENEVATNVSELNENTVVTTYFYPLENTCNYPKLRVIFCDAWADFLESAKGLESLEYIKGAALFGQLISSEGLKNLVRVDEDAYFNNMEDFSYLNSKLVIKGVIKLKEGLEPKIFELK